MQWQESVQSGRYEYKVNAQKLEMMASTSGKARRDVQDRNVRRVKIKQMEKFIYSDSTLTGTGACEVKVEEKIKTGRTKHIFLVGGYLD